METPGSIHEGGELGYAISGWHGGSDNVANLADVGLRPVHVARRAAIQDVTLGQLDLTMAACVEQAGRR